MKRRRLELAQRVYQYIVRSEAYKCAHRLKESAFTRKRRLSFGDIIHFLCCSRKHRNQMELELYFAAKGEQTVSRQALAKAREQIDPLALVEICDRIVANYEQTCDDIKTYKGYRLIAVDGSNIDLPNNAKVRLFFGCSSNGTGKEYAKGLAMAAYDVLNKITIFAELYRYDDSEKRRILDIADVFRSLPVYENALFLLDRGYPSFELFERFAENRQKYLVRVSSNSLKEINESKSEDSVIDIQRKSRHIQVRVLNVTLPNGDVEKLVTNLFDLPGQDLAELYRLRWAAETNFNFLKNKQLLETFTGESVIAIRQDFYASLFMQNMAAFAYADQEDTLSINAAKSKRKYEYKPNLSQLIYDIKTLWIQAPLGRGSAKIMRTLVDDYARILSFSYANIPNRHYPRSTDSHRPRRKSHPKPPL